MKPRCKPGDLAFILRGPNAGAIVHVIRAYRDGEMIAGSRWIDQFDSGTPSLAWVIQSAGGLLKHRYVTGQQAPDDAMAVLVDKELKPIRPGKGQDEVLRITGRPKATTKPKTTPAAIGSAA